MAMLSPQARGRDHPPARLPDAAAPDDRVRPARRADPVPELARRPGCRPPRRRRPDRCEAYLAHRRYLLDENGTVVGEHSPATRRAAAQVVVDLVNYRELFTADRVAVGLRPWGGVAPSAVAEMPHGPGRTRPRRSRQRPAAAAGRRPLPDGHHRPARNRLHEQVRDADRRWSHKHGDHVPLLHAARRTDHAGARRLRAAARHPLPLAAEHVIRDRLANGWSPDDPLARLSLGLLARQAGFTQFWSQWIPDMRSRIEETLGAVGAEKPFGRSSPAADRADRQGAVPWTLPLHRPEAVALIGIVRTASIIVLAAVSGMRSSELMELRSRLPPSAGGVRCPAWSATGWPARSSRASRSAAPRRMGRHRARIPGRAARRASPRRPTARDVRCSAGSPSTSATSGSGTGSTAHPASGSGSPPIPDGPVSLRLLRRTLAIELAYRPGGVLATKLHLKHIAVATTEGYASRPGGAQAELLAEVNKHEAERNLELVWPSSATTSRASCPPGPAPAS